MTAISATVAPIRRVEWTATCPLCLGLATWTQAEGQRPACGCPCENWKDQP